MVYKKCPICGSPAELIEKEGFEAKRKVVKCYRCSNFTLNFEGFRQIDSQILETITNEQIANISGWIRENQDSKIILTEEKIKSLMILQTLTVFEKANLILKYLGNKYPVAGTAFNYEFSSINQVLNNNDDELFNENKVNKKAKKLLPLVSIGRIINKDEFIYIIETYLRNEKEYLSNSLNRITPAGWAYLESLRQANPESKKAFVAMWFEPKMEKIYDNYIKKAIENSGFKPIQIGKKEHNNDINDEIIGEIRSSKFIVADFTGNRGGVYYEAGFAYGYNIAVIHTCQEDQLKNVHFDVNHRNIIKWSDGEDLYNKLLNRIKATIT